MRDPSLMQAPEDAREALDMLRGVGGEELVRTLLRTFVEFSDAQLARADGAAARGDASEVAKVAHSLKSSARQVGAMPFADACAATERACVAAAPDVAAVRAGVGTMREEYARAREWLAALAAAA